MQPIPLVPIRTFRDDSRFQRLLSWSYGTSTFYESQVTRLLHDDIPNRLAYKSCQLWVYVDPDGNEVGFASLQVSDECIQFTNGKSHAYIPLLAVNPAFMRLGHSRTIVEHLIEESRFTVDLNEALSDFVFLDVYEANQKAISVYQKNGFEILNPTAPISDPAEKNERYFVMAKHVRDFPILLDTEAQPERK